MTDERTTTPTYRRLLDRLAEDGYLEPCPECGSAPIVRADGRGWPEVEHPHAEMCSTNIRFEVEPATTEVDFDSDEWQQWKEEDRGY